MVKMSFTNNQTAFEYALYMIAGSYFDKATCKSKLIERNMLLQYKEQKIDKQYQMEDMCIRFMNKLAHKLPRNYLKQNMEVHLVRHQPGKPMEIIFANNTCMIDFICRYAGNKSKIDYRLWTK